MLAKSAEHELDGATSSLSPTRLLDHRVSRWPRPVRRLPVSLRRPRGPPSLPGPPRRPVDSQTPPLCPGLAVPPVTGPLP